MKIEKKIFFEKNDTIEDVIDELRETATERVVIHVSKNSLVGSGIKDFHKLKGIAEEEGKDILIESADDHILELADLAGIPAVNPVSRVGERSISDILPAKKTPRGTVRKLEPEDALTVEDRQKEEILKNLKRRKEKMEEPRMADEPRIPERDHFGEKEKDIEKKETTWKIKKTKPRKKTKNFYIFAVSALVLVLGIGAALFFILPSAEITLSLKKIPIEINEIVTVSSKVTTYEIPASQSGSIVLPGELLTAKKNAVLKFSATKKENVKEKAKGTLIVYNAFSSSPQTLVATTRFESPDGKIFRSVSSVTIPGAKVDGNNITPSSAPVEVVATEEGEGFNLPAGLKWKIPGFKGTSRYTTFYAENPFPMSGGFIGEKFIPEDGDIKKAEQELASVIKDAILGQFLVLTSERSLTFLDGASSFSLTKIEQQEIKDDLNSFGLFGEAEMKQLAFSEEMLKEALFKKLKAALPNDPEVMAFSFEIQYGIPEKNNLGGGEMNLPVTGRIVFAAKIERDITKESMKGLDESALRKFIFSLPGVENAQIQFSPFWVRSVPKVDSRIRITLN